MSPYIMPGIRKHHVQLTKAISIDDIKNVVECFTGISIEKMEAKTRKKEVVEARQISMYLCKRYTKQSLKSISEAFGGRNHTTAIHSIQTVKNLMSTEDLFKEKVLMIEEKIPYNRFVNSN